jgi:hypothetical protein
MPDTNDNDVKPTADASSATAKSDEKALNAIVDSVMTTQGGGKDSSTKPEDTAPQDAKPAGDAPKESETGEMTEEEVKEEKEEVAKPEEGEGDENEQADEKEPDDDEKADKPEDTAKHEKAVPYERFVEVNEKLKSSEPLAQAQRELVQHLRASQIDSNQFSEGLQVMALVNSDPEKALATFEGYVDRLRVQLGKGLPADLQKEVTEGLLSENRAKELAQSRLKAQTYESTNRYSQMAQQNAEQQQIVDSMSVWMSSKQKLNPSFVPKAKPTDSDGPFEDFLKNNTWLFTQRRPANGQRFTPYEMTGIAEEAYTETLKMAQRYTPKPKAHKVLSSTSASQRSHASADPKSEKDVVEQIAAKYKLS